jgi:hypothetical protein
VLLCGCANHAPAIVPIGNQTIETGKTLEFTVRAVDGDGDSLQFSADGLPPGARFSELGGNEALFSWTPIASDAGPDGRGQSYPVTFKASDGIDVATETVIITVTLGGAGTGAPVFITPSDYTLDLNRSNQIRLNIEVHDPDSASIDISLVSGILGGQFQTVPGSKLATYEWTPSEAQIAERPVWGLQVRADDHQNPPVTQDISILLKGGAQKCEGTPPSLSHKELGDQRVAGDYPISATAQDAESDVQAVALYFLVDTGQGAGGSFEKRSMTQATGDNWQASITNPNLTGTATATVHYYLCAVDSDDPDTGACNQRTCLPSEGRYSFTAYAPGNTGCQDDDMEQNDAPGEATPLSPGTYNLRRVCPGDEDWYRVAIPAQHWMGVGIDHTRENGALEIDVLDSTGANLLAAGQVDGNWVIAYLEASAQARTVLVRVRGAAGVENSYGLALVLELEVPCEPDRFEPNDSAQEATPVQEDVYENLTLCNELDWYRIDLNQGDGLDVLIEFQQAQGDLDLWIVDQNALAQPQITPDNALCAGITETDDEECSLASLPATGRYWIIVSPYNQARTGYTMTVLVTPASGGCQDDAREQNDTPAEATGVWTGQPLDGLKICPHDDDWFVTYMYVGERLVVQARFTHAAGDLDLKLYSAGVTPQTLSQHQLASSTSATNDERIEYSVTQEGDHYVRVYGYNGAENTYSLELSLGN